MEGESRVTKAMVEAAAAVLNPRALADAPYTIGCDGPWHYEGHSFHSSCSCGSNEIRGKKWLAEDKIRDADRARREAKRVLKAAFAATKKATDG
jgi:hypothetical protein